MRLILIIGGLGILGVFGGNLAGLATDNKAPEVEAGAEGSATFSSVYQLQATVTDDGLPNPPGKLTVQWRKKSGPGVVAFNQPDAAGTYATFSQPGIYRLTITAGDGELTASDTVRVTVHRKILPEL